MGTLGRRVTGPCVTVLRTNISWLINLWLCVFNFNSTKYISFIFLSWFSFCCTPYAIFHFLRLTGRCGLFSWANGVVFPLFDVLNPVIRPPYYWAHNRGAFSIVLTLYWWKLELIDLVAGRSSSVSTPKVTWLIITMKYRENDGSNRSRELVEYRTK